MEPHKIRLTDLLPVGYERYKDRNNLATAYSTRGWDTSRRTEPKVEWRAEFLNQYHFMLDAALLGTGLVIGMVGVGCGIVGAQKLYHTLEQVISKIF